MCLILAAVGRHPEYELVLAANRDEFYRRPSLPAAPWAEAPDVIGGRDLEKGGSWLAVSSGGRFACVTNFRETLPGLEPSLSRGLLVADFVRERVKSVDYLNRVRTEAHLYRGFSLLVGVGGKVGYISNRGPQKMLGPGVYGIANALLDSPWPKVLKGKQGLARQLEEPVLDPEALFDLLADRSASEGGNPGAGLPGSPEEPLAPIFVRTPTFGTRCSTLVLIRRTGETTLIERTFAPTGEEWNEVRWKIT